MKSILRLSVCLVASAAALFATGCQKRPLRPNPSQTVLSGGGPETLTPFEGGLGQTTLQERPMGSAIDDADFNQLQAVLFDFDSAAIRVAERAKVQEAANFLKSNPGARLLLVGRCDWRGTTEYNMGLGDRRGRAVKDFLATLGISADSVEVLSKGDLDAQEGGGDSAMQQDRRVDVGVLR